MTSPPRRSPRSVLRLAAAIVLLSASVVTVASQTPALRVVSAGPTGELTQLGDADQVRIVFSEPMIVLGTVPTGAAPPWVQLTPAVPGSYYWSGTKMLVFSPDVNTPLPYATPFTVRIDGRAASLSGRTLGAPYEFSFTTPTVRLIGIDWFRQNGRFDSAAVMQWRFNQPVRPEDAVAHAHVALTPHAWTEPSISAPARSWLERNDPGGLDRFRQKVARVQGVVASSDAVNVRAAATWDTQRFPPAADRVVIETTMVPPSEGWLTVTLDGDLPSPAGPARHAAQSSVVRLEPAFFVAGMRCTTNCDPQGYNAAPLTRAINWPAGGAALTITDVSNPAAEQPVAPVRALDESLGGRQTNNLQPADVGYDRQPPARTWRWRLDSDLTATDGQTLGYPWVEVVENIHALPAIGVAGTLWEASGGPTVPMSARNVRSAAVWMTAITPPNVMSLLQQLQNARGVPPLPPVAPDARSLTIAPDVFAAHGVDLRRVLSPPGTGLVWLATESDTTLPGAVMPPNFNSRRSSLVQVTNLGINVKDSPQSTLVFVTRLDTGAPVPEAHVSIVNASSQTRWRGTTDRDGVALAPPLALRAWNRTYDLSFIVTAEKEGDLAYVASNSNGVPPWSWNLNYQLRESPTILRGSVFTDRGVYKEDDDVHLKVVLRDDTPEAMTLAAAGASFDVLMSDDRGREVDRRTITVNRWSSAEWTWHVPAGALLGYYSVQIGRPGTFTANRNQDLVRGNFLVAAYRRPDFRVDATLTSDPQVLGATLQGGVDAKYLFGSALGSRPVRWWFRRNTIMSAPAAIAERYPEARYAVGYVPSGDGSRPPDAPLPTKTELLGPDGHLTVSLPTAAEGDAAYGYTFEGDVEDVSGQHIANRATLVVHPASLYVAINRPPMFADVKTGLNLGIVASDLTGRAVADVPVTVGLFRERWNYSALPGGGWKREEIPAGEWTIRTSSGETSLPIPLRDGGCYVIHATARDAAGRRTRTDVTFYALGPGMTSWRGDGYRIDLTPERKTWKPGESARILIQSPWDRATALVTVEREGIRHHRTFTIASTQDTVEVPITEADVPNVYVSVVLVKGRTSNQLASDGSDPDQPSYRIGYTELTVDNAAKQLRVDVSADKEEYRPHQPAKVSVTVKGSDGRPVAGEVTLWAMDYGLLSLTDYKTPDVLRSIYANKALQVMTEDNRVGLISRKPLAADNGRNSTIAGLAQETVTVTSELVMLQGQQGAGVGGGRGGGGAFRNMASEPAPQAMPAPAPPPGVEVRQDFRPLVFWLGSATTGTDGRAMTDVTLPDSLTTYRIMAVAGDPQSRFGFGDHEIHVTKPLTLLPQFPRFLSQGDRASFGAVVTNSGKTPGVATVTVQSLAAGTLEFSTRTSQTVRLEPGASAPVKFDALARTAGSARVRMLVTLGTETDAFEMPLSVSAPMRLETTAAYGDTIDSAIERIVLPPGISRTAGGLNVELASTALVGLGEGARYVTEYPYECAEQKASRALALLLASDLGGAFKLTNIPADQYQSQGALALRELAGYQCGSGGFSLWPGGCGTESAYLTAYVLHVMKIGDEHGVTSDRYAVDRALQYLQTQLRQQPPEAQWWPVWGASQAFSVKVLAEFGRNQPADITRLLGVADRLPIFALSNLADALAASGNRGSQYQDVVRRLGNALRVEADRAHVEEFDEDTLAWLWNSNVRATAVVLDGLSRRRDDATLVPALVRWLVAARTNGRWGTTHENAMALEALVSYYRAFESDVPNMTSTVRLGNASIGSATFTGRSTTAQQVQLSMSDLLRQLASSASAPALTIARTGTGRVFYTARVQYLAPEAPEAVDRGFHVERRYEPYVPNSAGPATTSFAPGDLVRVTVTLTLRGEGRYLALTDPLPAGFEPLEGWFKTTASDLGRQATRTNTGNDWLSVWRRGTFDHVEKHDDRVVAFATRLGSGRHEFSYLVRATTAGTFTAAGSRIEAMYAPEVTGRSAASTITVR